MSPIGTSSSKSWQTTVDHIPGVGVGDHGSNAVVALVSSFEQRKPE
jgi:hypothetical protein